MAAVLQMPRPAVRQHAPGVLRATRPVSQLKGRLLTHSLPGPSIQSSDQE